jgi:cytochrome P450
MSSPYPELLHKRSCIDPHALLKRMRENDPIIKLDGLQGWFVTQYDDASAIYKDSRVAPGGLHQMIDLMPKSEREQLKPLRELVVKLMLSVSPQVHKPLVQSVRQYFSAEQLKKLRDPIEHLVAQLLNGIETEKNVDIISRFCFPFPATVIALIMGVPESDRHRFPEWVSMFRGIFFTSSSFEQWLDGQKAFLEMCEYCEALLEEKLKNPTNDLMSVFAQLVAAGELDRDVILANCPFILFAGHDTVATLLGELIQAVALFPDQMIKVKQEPSLIPNAIQELIRCFGPAPWVSRIVLEGFEFRGAQFKKNDLLYLCNEAANRDPAVYPDPDTFDVTRSFKAKMHLGFGHGAHYCLGAGLAQVESEIVLSHLINYYPQMRVHLDSVRYQECIPVSRVVKHLEVSLTPESK